MLGCIVGDIAGSLYEFKDIKLIEDKVALMLDEDLLENKPFFFDDFLSDKSFPTDDSVLTIATCYALLKDIDYGDAYSYFSSKYPDKGYGSFFKKWMELKVKEPYGSYGNGSAMRVAPVGCVFDEKDEVETEALKSSACTHNSSEGIKGAQAVAMAVFAARKYGSKDSVREIVENHLGRECLPVEHIKNFQDYNNKSIDTVMKSLAAFEQSADFEDAIRLAISFGGDTDTIACITGGIAEAYYGYIPEYMIKRVKEVLPEELMNILTKFYEVFLSNENRLLLRQS